MAVVICDAFGDPEIARVRRPRKIPWTQLDRSQPLHIPDMKKLVGNRVERLFIHFRISQRAWHDDLGRHQVLHAVAGMTVGGEVNQESVRLELRRAPHRGFGPHDLFNIAH